MMDPSVPRPTLSRWPWLAGGCALLLFGLTSTVRPVPDGSAAFLVDALRLSPFPSMDRPLWGGLVRILDALAPGYTVALANGLSVVLGALAVALLARLVEGSLGHRPSRHAPGLEALAGVVAGLALATSIPFWLVSNRAHPATLGLVLALSAMVLFQHYRRQPRGLALVAGTLLYAAGMAELPTLLVLAPVIAGQVLVSLWQQRQLTVGRVCALAGLLVVTPLIWWMAAWSYARLPAADWREMHGVGEALRYELIAYRDTLLRSVPRQGWLIILFTSVLPWLVAFLGAKSKLPPRLHAGTWLLHLLVTLLLLAMAWNAPLTPWAILGTQPLLVMPYVLVASALAYQVAYWGGVLALRLERMSRPPGRGLTAVMALVLLCLLAVAGIRAAPEVSTRSAVPVQRIAETMVAHLGTRDVLVTHGLLSDQIRLLNWQRGRNLMVLDAPVSEYSGYRRYLASLFDEPRRQSLALAGLAPVLVDWLANDPALADRLAVQPNPDLWLSEGFQPLPLATCFAGVRAVSTQDVEQVRQVAADFWAQAGILLGQVRATAPRLTQVADELAAHWSRVANDTGVFFEHQGDREAARRAYAQARLLDPDNVSAAANLVVLGQAAGWSGVDLEEADLALAVAPRDRPLYEVYQRYGHLRRREAAQLLGAAVRLATDAPTAEDVEWQAALEVYQRGDRVEARRQVEQIIQKRPEFDPAWIVLANLAYEQGDEATLQKCVRQMREVRREWPEIPVLLGRLALERGDLATAREYLERAAVLRPSELAILDFLLQLDLRERDYRRAENRARQLLSAHPDSVAGLIGLGAALRSHERWGLAEDTLRRVLEIQRHPQALAELALVLADQGRLDEAQPLAEEAVRTGPRLPATHEALGILLFRKGAMPEAIAALQNALALDGQRWATRVYLAAALQQGGQVEPAAALARTLRKERHPKDRELDRVLANVPE